MTDGTHEDEQSRVAADCPNERIVMHDYKEKYLLLSAKYCRDIDDLRSALAELVALKAIKERIDAGLISSTSDEAFDYYRRKPLAWDRAKAAIDA